MGQLHLELKETTKMIPKWTTKMGMVQLVESENCYCSKKEGECCLAEEVALAKQKELNRDKDLRKASEV